MTLPGSVAAAIGEPATVRIGVVTSTSPLRVNVQSTEYRNLGLIGASPQVGDVVALLGQSTSVASDASSWLVLGKVSGEQTVSGWIDYPMVWTSNIAPNPSVGAGSIVSRYLPIGYKTILVEVGIAFGAGMNQGGGRWFFSCPMLASVASGSAAGGACYLFDSGTANRAAIVNITSSRDAYFVTNSPNGDVGAGVPQVWASGDMLRFTIIHEVA